MAGRPSYTTIAEGPFADTATRRLRPPADLGPREKAAFVNLVSAHPAEHFTSADLPILTRWAENTVLAEQAYGEMVAAGVVSDGKVSPWFSIHQQATQALLRLSRALRIGPSQRHHKASKAVTGQISVYEKLQLEGYFDDGPKG